MINYNLTTNIKAQIIWALMFVFFNTTAQNLVPNPSFENFITCPSKNYKPAPPPWYLATKNGPVYLNACDTSKYASVPLNVTKGFSFQYARTGSAYIYIDYENGITRGYIQVKLLDSLISGHCYYVEHFVNVPNPMKYACNNIGMLFTYKAIYVDTIGTFYGLLPANPQVLCYGNPIITDTLNWIKVSGIYKAKGGEQYLTLGNFLDNAHTNSVQIQTTGYAGAGYYIDDVSVIPLDSMQLKADAGRDTTIVKGDSVWIGSRLCGLTNVVWYNAANNVIDTGAPGLWVKPTSNTFYVIEQNVCGQYSRDTVFVNVQPLPVSMLNFECLMLNERQVKVSWETANEINVSHFNVQRSIDGITFETIGKVNAKGASTYNFNDPLTTHDSRFTTLYYRLQVVDKNGNKTYSEIKNISIGYNKEIKVFPNPTSGMINIQFPGSGNWQITITDMEGRIVWQNECRGCNGTIKHNLSGSKSVYFIKIINKLSGQQSINKIILQ